MLFSQFPLSFPPPIIQLTSLSIPNSLPIL
jgi:hypothetical protein